MDLLTIKIHDIHILFTNIIIVNKSVYNIYVQNCYYMHKLSEKVK